MNIFANVLDTTLHFLTNVFVQMLYNHINTIIPPTSFFFQHYRKNKFKKGMNEKLKVFLITKTSYRIQDIEKS